MKDPKATVPDIISCENSLAAQECIDEIHEKRNQRLTQGMPMLKDELDYWAKSNYLPSQMDTVLCLAILDAKRADEKRQN